MKKDYEVHIYLLTGYIKPYDSIRTGEMSIALWKFRHYGSDQISRLLKVMVF